MAASQHLVHHTFIWDIDASERALFFVCFLHAFLPKTISHKTAKTLRVAIAKFRGGCCCCCCQCCCLHATSIASCRLQRVRYTTTWGNTHHVPNTTDNNINGRYKITVVLIGTSHHIMLEIPHDREQCLLVCVAAQRYMPPRRANFCVLVKPLSVRGSLSPPTLMAMKTCNLPIGQQRELGTETKENWLELMLPKIQDQLLRNWCHLQGQKLNFLFIGD